MKNHLFLIITLFISLTTTSLGQNYNSIFGQDSIEWTIPYCQLGQAYTTNRIAIEDTVIAGLNYKKVGTHTGNSIDYSMNGLAGITNGFLREDTLSGKIWFMGTTNDNATIDTVEYLIADLSLSLGDPFSIKITPGFDSITVVDSVYYDAGIKHVRLNFSPIDVGPGFEKVTFVEGVGTNYGFAYIHFNVAYNLCPCLKNYKKDGTSVYSNLNCTTVNNVSIVSAQELLNVKIYPHPIVGSSTFKFDNTTQEKVQLILYDATGKIITRYQTNKDYIELQKNIHTGFCYYQLQIGEQKKVSGKMIFLD